MNTVDQKVLPCGCRFSPMESCVEISGSGPVLCFKHGRAFEASWIEVPVQEKQFSKEERRQ